MAISPRTQSFMQPPPTIEDETSAFEEGFSQMAHRILETKFPELVEHVVTFKILSSDLDTNSGVGAFVMSRGGDTLYIPVILANNKIKPVMMLLHKDKNVYLPLKEGWLQEIDSGALDDLGQSVKPPKTLETDVDIRRLVLPPMSGRQSYASEKGAVLADFLEKAPNRVKTAFKQILEKNQKVLKFAFETYDKDLLLNSLQPHSEKVAEEIPAVDFLTPENTSDDFLSVFGKKAAEAFQTATKLGYVVRDLRPDNNIAVETEEPLCLHEANENGVYQLRFSDGSVKKALVIADPQSLESNTVAGKLTGSTRRPSETDKYRKKKQKDILENTTPTTGGGKSARYLVYTEDSKIYDTDYPPIGKMLNNEDMKIEEALTSPNSQGFFLRMKGGRPTTTRLFEIDKVTTGKDGVRRITTMDGRVLVTDPKSAIDHIVAPEGAKTTYIPPTFKFIKGERDFDLSLLRTSDENLRYTETLEKNGAFKVKVKDAGAGMFSISGLVPSTKLATLRRLVVDLKIAAPDAQKILEKTAERGHCGFHLVTIGQFLKYAQEMTMDPTSQPGAAPPAGAPPMEMAPGMAPGMSPEMSPEMMQGMAPEMMPPMPPPGPTPTEQAVTQMSAELAQQAAETTQQLQDRMTILSEVQARADQIATEATMPPEELAAQAEPPIDMAAELGDSEAFEATAIGALAANPDLKTTVTEFMPTLEQALDNLGRILLTLWMEEESHRTELGEEDYVDMEKQLRSVFDNLGSLILKINQTAMATTDGKEGTQS